MLTSRSTVAMALFGLFLAASSPAAEPQSQDLARTLQISFVPNNPSVVLLNQGGRTYQIDVANKSVTDITASASQPQPPSEAAAALFRQNCAACHGAGGRGIASLGTPDFTHVRLDQASIAQMIRSGNTKMPSFATKLSPPQIAEISQWVNSLSAAGASAKPQAEPLPSVYQPGDDVLFTLPTGRPTDRGAWIFNFTHRFPYDPAFQGPGRGGELFGLDDFSLSSFGLRYGVTSRLSVSAFRSPSFIGRPIQLMAAYNVLSEQDHAPFNLAFRASVEGQNNFRKNYTENIEAIVSKSLTHRAQIYFVPTVSFNARRVVQGSLDSNQIPDYPGVNAFSLGVGAAFDIRPTVALLAEIIPTLAGGPDLGIHRPAFSFAIQKKIYRHAFTFGFTNSPGVTVSQRAGTDATFLNNPSGDLFQKLFVGFDLTRRIH